MKVKHEHLVPAPIDKVLAAYKDDQFYIQKLKNSGALTVDIFEKQDLPDGSQRKKARVTEPSRIPPIPFLKKADVDTYVDDHVVDPNARKLTYKIIPAQFADKFFLSGSVEFKAEGSGTRMVFTTELEVKVFGVGGTVEKVGLAKTEEEVRRQVEFVKKWMAEH
jgi:hypothetical protein